MLDVARPRNVSRRVAQKRDDVLVIEGGMVAVPGPDMDFGFDFGFPPRMAFACMAEVMILALEGRYESFTLGRDITVDQVQEIEALGARHGFKLGGFRSFERAVTDQEIERVRRGRSASARMAQRTKTQANATVRGEERPCVLSCPLGCIVRGVRHAPVSR